MAGLVQDELGVTCVVNDAGPIQLPSAAYDVAKGQLTSAYGALGNFKLEFAGLQTLHPAGPGRAGYTPAQTTARSECDVFIDLRGGAPAFPSHEKRNGISGPIRTKPASWNALPSQPGNGGRVRKNRLFGWKSPCVPIPGPTSRAVPGAWTLPHGSDLLCRRPHPDRF